MREHVAKNLLQPENAPISRRKSWRCGLEFIEPEIGLLEREERLPRVDHARQNCRGLGVTPCVLLEGITGELGVTWRGQFEVSIGDSD